MHLIIIDGDNDDNSEEKFLLFFSVESFNPPVPFSLGMLIVNEGYGIANDLQISSSQPKITDNEKGLLVDFQVVSAELENTGLMPSLTVKFGDIQPHSTKMARWIMTSSVTGTFSNYSATFVNNNPLGNVCTYVG